MKAHKPKRDNFVLNITGVNSLRLMYFICDFQCNLTLKFNGNLYLSMKTTVDLHRDFNCSFCPIVSKYGIISIITMRYNLQLYHFILQIFIFEFSCLKNRKRLKFVKTVIKFDISCKLIKISTENDKLNDLVRTFVK